MMRWWLLFFLLGKGPVLDIHMTPIGVLPEHGSVRVTVHVPIDARNRALTIALDDGVSYYASGTYELTEQSPSVFTRVYQNLGTGDYIAFATLVYTEDGQIKEQHAKTGVLLVR